MVKESICSHHLVKESIRPHHLVKESIHSLHLVKESIRSLHSEMESIRSPHLEMGYCLSVVLEVLTEWKAGRHQGKEYFHRGSNTLAEVNHKTQRPFSRWHQSCTLDRGRTASYNPRLIHCYLETEYNQSHPMMTEPAIHGNPSRNTALAREMELELELELELE